MKDTISRWAAAKAIYRALKTPVPDYRKDPFHDTMGLAFAMADEIPSADPEQQPGRIFQNIVVEYPSLSTYPECKGKPYFSIKYTENGQEFIGYGTYKPEVLSEYLKEYFMQSAQPEIIRCKYCTHYHEDVWGDEIGHDDIPLILAHQMCDFWGRGCKTKEDAFCSYAERRTDADD